MGVAIHLLLLMGSSRSVMVPGPVLPPGTDGAIERGQQAAQECYRRAGWDELFLRMKLYIKVTVDPLGRVRSVAVDGPKHGPASSLGPCFVEVVSPLPFPAASHEYEVELAVISRGSPAQRRAMAKVARLAAITRFELRRGSLLLHERPFAPRDCVIEVSSNWGIAVRVDQHNVRPSTHVEVKVPCGKHVLDVIGIGDDSRARDALDLRPGKPFRKYLQQDRINVPARE